MDEPLVVVQCRFRSTRLPGKALLDLCGTPVLAFLLRRLKDGLPRHGYRIVTATTQRPEDDKVAACAEQEGIEVVRGPEHDVLGRYRACLDRFPAGIVVRVTADNPLTCPEVLTRTVAVLQREGSDYVQFQGYPYGAVVDAFTADLLDRLDAAATDPAEREHINLHVMRHRDRFRVCLPRAAHGLARGDLRMTVDTPADIRNVRRIFRPGEPHPWRLTLVEAIRRMDSPALRGAETA